MYSLFLQLSLSVPVHVQGIIHFEVSRPPIEDHHTSSNTVTADGNCCDVVCLLLRDRLATLLLVSAIFPLSSTQTFTNLFSHTLELTFLTT